jgi:hypothetical protein
LDHASYITVIVLHVRAEPPSLKIKNVRRIIQVEFISGIIKHVQSY